MTTLTGAGRIRSSLSVIYDSDNSHVGTTRVTATHDGDEDVAVTIRCVGNAPGIQQAARDAHSQVVLTVIALRGL